MRLVGVPMGNRMLLARGKPQSLPVLVRVSVSHPMELGNDKEDPLGGRTEGTAGTGLRCGEGGGFGGVIAGPAGSGLPHRAQRGVRIPAPDRGGPARSRATAPQRGPPSQHPVQRPPLAALRKKPRPIIARMALIGHSARRRVQRADGRDLRA